LGVVATAGLTAFAAFRSDAAATRSDSSATRSAEAAERASAAADTLARIERDRRHTEMTPRFRVACRTINPGSDQVRMIVELIGPPSLDRVDELTLTIRNDYHRRGDGPRLAISPSEEEVKAHIWGPYKLARGVSGVDGALPDATGRTITYPDLPLGEVHLFVLEPTYPARWMQGYTHAEWLRDRGTVIRFELKATHSEYGTWRLPGEVDTAGFDDDAAAATTTVPSV
jgi:hypothetical protein